MKEQPAIAVFARAPIPGRVKTRLIGPLSAEQSCELHRAFVRDTWAMLADLAAPSALRLYTDSPHEEWSALAGPAVRLQKGEQLGERMLNCFQELLEEGRTPLMILGSDNPTLPATVLAPWTELLRRWPALLGPAEDGGYYAVGCRAPHPRMFEGVEWSSPQTLAQTESSLRRCGLPPAFLAPWYDVDKPEDLTRLAAEPSLPSHTKRWIERYFE